MENMAAFARGAAARAAGLSVMVFDWDKAAKLMQDRRAKEASAGLAGDWDWTGGQILRDGLPVPSNDTRTYLASTWAIPQIKIDGKHEDCWRWEEESPGWNAYTYWPSSAKALLYQTVATDAPERNR